MKKLGVIVPYRDRKEHLNLFKRRISYQLKEKNIPHEIIVVNQYDYGLFNRGMLLNVGFFYAVQLGCDYVVFHDVDMIPVEVDYSYSNIPLHLATNFIDQKSREPVNPIFDEYFGGVTMFKVEDFKKINGYSNKYWGWGYEDTDLLLRCKICDLPLNELKIKNTSTKGVKLRFNGTNAFVQCKNFGNLMNLNSPLTLFVSFFPDEITLNHVKVRDEFTIFSIPGYSSEITYNSFMRYTFQTFDNLGECINLDSEIKTNYQTSIAITINPKDKSVTMFQDGKKISSKNYEDKLHDYSLEQIFYLGCMKNDMNSLDNFFKGLLNKFAVYSDVLPDDELIEITKFETELNKNNKNYNSAKKLSLYYDTNYIKEYRLVDLSGNANDGQIFNCEIVEPEIDEYKIIKIPHRRSSEFLLLNHEQNGYLNRKWKTNNTRWNQLRFHNEFSKNHDLYKEDGLNNLHFNEHSLKKENNYNFINVTIT